MLVYVPRQRTAAAARGWLLLIFLLPWPGIVFYALVGRIYLPKDRLLRQERASKKIRLVQEQMLARSPALPSLPPNVSPLAALAARLGDFEPLHGNRVELLTDYYGSIQRLIADIDGGAPPCPFTVLYLRGRCDGAQGGGGPGAGGGAGREMPAAARRGGVEAGLAQARAKNAARRDRSHGAVAGGPFPAQRGAV